MQYLAVGLQSRAGYYWQPVAVLSEPTFKAVLQAQRKRQRMGDVKLVLAGCVASQEGATLLRRIPELDLVMGPHHANQ